MSGKLEPTNRLMNIKLTAIELHLAKQYGHKILNLMPTNLYGPNDNFSEIDSHVIPGLICRMHNSKISNDYHLASGELKPQKRIFICR